MKLKVKTETIHKVDYNDLDEFITTVFGEPNGIEDAYECVPFEEWSNDESHTIKVSAETNDYIKKYENPSIDEMIQNKEYENFSTSTILNYLCRQGKIAPGDYLIEISW